MPVSVVASARDRRRAGLTPTPVLVTQPPPLRHFRMIDVTGAGLPAEAAPGRVKRTDKKSLTGYSLHISELLHMKAEKNSAENA